MIDRVQQKLNALAPNTENQQPVDVPQPEQMPELEVPAEPKKEIELPNIEARIELPKIGRNDTVTIVKGSEQLTLKFKKAESMILNEGWRLVKWER